VHKKSRDTTAELGSLALENFIGLAVAKQDSGKEFFLRPEIARYQSDIDPSLPCDVTQSDCVVGL
jgi:hypothetical protein